MRVDKTEGWFPAWGCQGLRSLLSRVDLPPTQAHPLPSGYPRIWVLDQIRLLTDTLGNWKDYFFLACCVSGESEIRYTSVWDSISADEKLTKKEEYFCLTALDGYRSWRKLSLPTFWIVIGNQLWLPLWLCSSLSHVWLFATPWTVARQAPLTISPWTSLRGYHLPGGGNQRPRQPAPASATSCGFYLLGLQYPHFPY